MQADKLKQAQEALERLTPEERQKLADWLVKLAQAFLALVPFRIVVGNLIERRAQIN